MRLHYYWNFKNEGIHTVKIIFRKKLYNSNYMFSRCKNIIEIDCSNFDCSQITDCSNMFSYCNSLKTINLGELDFPLTETFSAMFYDCRNLEELDVSHFNTQNSLSFASMFDNCEKLKVIDVSKFNSSKCQNIDFMFRNCSNLTEINMLNWDMSSIKESNRPIFFRLFSGCKKLKSIKMSGNHKNKDFDMKNSRIFEDLPDNGSFTWKEGEECNKLLLVLPPSWNRKQV